MDWIAIIELLLPILLELLKNSPEDEALRRMENPGMFERLRVRKAVRSLDAVLAEQVFVELAKLTKEQKKELIAMSKAL